MGRATPATPMAAEPAPICTWGDRHRHQPVFVLGNGPSLAGLDLTPLRRFVTVGCNRILRVFDPTYWVFADEQSIDPSLPNHVVAEARRSRAVCLTTPRYADAARALGLCTYEVNWAANRPGDPPTCGLSRHPGRLHTFGSMGLTCFSFAHATGADPIVLLGIDCGNGPGGTTNFYGLNPWQAQSNYAMWQQHCRWIQQRCTRRIINCGWVPCFERMTLNECIADLERCASEDRRGADC